jgi:predicted DNA-binding transcriptional regulator AlpA
MGDGERWINDRQVCEIRGCKPQTLRNERWRGKRDAAFARTRPPWYSFGRSVRYKESEIVEWCEAHRFPITEDDVEAVTSVAEELEGVFDDTEDGADDNA